MPPRPKGQSLHTANLMRWSVGIEAEADRVLTREQVVELADAVAASGGIATGIGTSRYGAQLIVEAASREAAIEKATAEFTRAAARAIRTSKVHGPARAISRPGERSYVIVQSIPRACRQAARSAH